MDSFFSSSPTGPLTRLIPALLAWMEFILIVCLFCFNSQGIGLYINPLPLAFSLGDTTRSALMHGVHKIRFPVMYSWHIYCIWIYIL